MQTRIMMSNEKAILICGPGLLLETYTFTVGEGISEFPVKTEEITDDATWCKLWAAIRNLDRCIDETGIGQSLTKRNYGDGPTPEMGSSKHSMPF